MFSTHELQNALKDWAEVFMARSMHEWVRYVRGTGLSMPQFSTLMRLYYRGQCGLSEITAELDVTAAAASQMVDRLVRDGYLARAEDPNDRRAKQITLTDHGRQLVADGIAVRNRWTESLAEHLDPAERAAVGQALRHLTEATRQLNEMRKNER
ncbi:MAG: MarR family transcriptional regulator [Anaerolineales bacterium]|nr:MarR family transcriptional regulator [Anaerolineales bacterium]